MKKVLFFIFLGLLFLQLVVAQDSKNTVNVVLSNGKYLQIQVCSNNIFRFRLSADNNFSESLMERYGILKSNWDDVKFNLKSDKGYQIIQTSDFQLSINKKTGEISLKDLKGNTIIERIACADIANSGYSGISESLNTYFGKSKSGGGIIGDQNYTGKQRELAEVGDPGKSSLLDISLKKDERFYGGGSTSRKNIQHRGTALRMWATYQKTEIPMPFLMSSSGWGIFNNTTSKNYFDIGRYHKDKMFIYNTEGDPDFYLMVGNSMPEVINLYTAITGKPYLLPKWAYGLAFGGNTMEDQFDVMNDAVRFRDEKIPCDIFWLEPQWMKKNYDFSTSKDWNLEKFPAYAFWEANNPKKYENRTLFIAKLHNLGYHLALWLCIDNDLSIEEEDHLAEKAGKPLSGLEHWFPHLTKFMDQGVDGFKLDPGRTLDEHPDRKYYNGYTDKEMHNLNQVLLPKQMYLTFREHEGIRSFHHYCGGYAGTQHWGASTSGDNGGGKDALFDQLNLGLSGFVNTSADVMEGINDNKAGIHLGFFLPWVQINSWYSLHHPWFLKPDEKETFRYYAQLRNSLSPYIYSAALRGSQTGMPILRAMPLMFPDDRKVDNMIYQYMFGDNLLVGVFSDSIYLPVGNWTDYWTGKLYSGGKTVRLNIPENRGGLLFIKAGAIIPYQKPMQFIGERPADTLIVRVYPEKRSSYTLFEDDGRSFEFEKGSIAKTLFECSVMDKETEFVIHPAEGSYPGIKSSRVYQIEFILSVKPVAVNVNGTKSESWGYSDSGTLTLYISQKSIREKQVVTIY